MNLFVFSSLFCVFLKVWVLSVTPIFNSFFDFYPLTYHRLAYIFYILSFSQYDTKLLDHLFIFNLFYLHFLEENLIYPCIIFLITFNFFISSYDSPFLYSHTLYFKMPTKIFIKLNIIGSLVQVLTESVTSTLGNATIQLSQFSLNH